jgi:chromosomal replication initiation ATPase DnaA
MNIHLATPTQLKALHEKRARDARIAAAARNAVAETRPNVRIINVTERAQREHERRMRQAQEAEQARLREERKAAKAKERWRASWRYMINLADNKAKEDSLIGMSDIIAQTSAKYGVSVIDMKSARRTRYALTQARFEACWRARRETLLSLPQIGRFLGNRDHTTVLHAVKQYEAMRCEVMTGERKYTRNKSKQQFLPEMIIVEAAGL